MRDRERNESISYPSQSKTTMANFIYENKNIEAIAAKFGYKIANYMQNRYSSDEYIGCVMTVKMRIEGKLTQFRVTLRDSELDVAIFNGSEWNAFASHYCIPNVSWRNKTDEEYEETITAVFNYIKEFYEW